MIASTACWADEPAPPESAPAHAPKAQSFDLRNESVKKIVHDTAATQFATGQVLKETPAEEQPGPRAVRYVPPEGTPKREPKYPTRLPDAQPSGGILSSLIDTVLEDDDITYAEKSKQDLACMSRDNMKTTAERVASCPGRADGGVKGNPADYKTVPSP